MTYMPADLLIGWTRLPTTLYLFKLFIFFFLTSYLITLQLSQVNRQE